MGKGINVRPKKWHSEAVYAFPSINSFLNKESGRTKKETHVFHSFSIQTEEIGHIYSVHTHQSPSRASGRKTVDMVSSWRLLLHFSFPPFNNKKKKNSACSRTETNCFFKCISHYLSLRKDNPRRKCAASWRQHLHFLRYTHLLHFLSLPLFGALSKKYMQSKMNRSMCVTSFSSKMIWSLASS